MKGTLKNAIENIYMLIDEAEHLVPQACYCRRLIT